MELRDYICYLNTDFDVQADSSIEVADMIASFANSTTASLMVKSGTKNHSTIIYKNSSPVGRFWSFRCLTTSLDKDLATLVDITIGGSNDCFIVTKLTS